MNAGGSGTTLRSMGDPETRVLAVVFDMDGVLLDSEPLHHRALNELLVQDGSRGLTFEEYVPYMGTTDEYTWTDLIQRFGLPHAFAHYRDRYDERILELYRGSSVLAPGAACLLDELKARRLPLAVASSSRCSWVESCLDALDIRHQFDVVVSGEMVRRSKPDPEIFLLAARLLGIAPTACLAIEDSPQGVAAAVASGMLTVAVDSPYPTAAQTSAAQIHLRSLEDFDCSLLDRSGESTAG